MKSVQGAYRHQPAAPLRSRATSRCGFGSAIPNDALRHLLVLPIQHHEVLIFDVVVRHRRMSSRGAIRRSFSPDRRT
eukprot:scaffold1249_cov243-Pinguiococcus_pyrenoidosus.AAC.8